MTSGAVIAVTLQAADEGDTTTIQETLAETAGNLAHLIEREAKKTPDEAPRVSLDPLAEIVADKGYHSNDAVLHVQQAQGRSYIPEPKRGQRRRVRQTSRKQCTPTVAGSKAITENSY
jgi:transposase